MVEVVRTLFCEMLLNAVTTGRELSAMGRKTSGRTRPTAPTLPYSEFRTGLSFEEVRRMLWTPSENPRDWRYKRRATVLGLWHQLKEQLYGRYLDETE